MDSKHCCSQYTQRSSHTNYGTYGSTKEHQLSLHDDFPPNFEDTHAQSLHVDPSYAPHASTSLHLKEWAIVKSASCRQHKTA